MLPLLLCMYFTSVHLSHSGLSPSKGGRQTANGDLYFLPCFRSNLFSPSGGKKWVLDYKQFRSVSVFFFLWTSDPSEEELCSFNCFSNCFFFNRVCYRFCFTCIPCCWVYLPCVVVFVFCHLSLFSVWCYPLNPEFSFLLLSCNTSTFKNTLRLPLINRMLRLINWTFARMSADTP